METGGGPEDGVSAEPLGKEDVDAAGPTASSCVQLRPAASRAEGRMDYGNAHRRFSCARMIVGAGRPALVAGASLILLSAVCSECSDESIRSPGWRSGGSRTCCSLLFVPVMDGALRDPSPPLGSVAGAPLALLFNKLGREANKAGE